MWLLGRFLSVFGLWPLGQRGGGVVPPTVIYIDGTVVWVAAASDTAIGIEAASDTGIGVPAASDTTVGPIWAGGS